MNNLYGWTMSRYFSYGRCNWLKNADNFYVNSIMKNIDIVYILEVHLEYSDELHILQIDYLLAPEKFAIPYEMLSDYYKKIADEYKIKTGDVKKINSKFGQQN